MRENALSAQPLNANQSTLPPRELPLQPDADFLRHSQALASHFDTTRQNVLQLTLNEPRTISHW